MSTLAWELAPTSAGSTARAVYRVACAVAGCLLIAGLAQLAIRLPFTPVPITGQTLGILLVGAAFGPILGAATLALYLLAGGIGLPFFAGGDSGWEVLGFASATGGYLWGFVLAAVLTGWLARNGWDRSFRSAIGAMLLGEIVLYAVGLFWLHRVLGGSVEKTLIAGLYPFVIGDMIKLLLAAGLLPGAWRLLKGLRPDLEA
jgi:biotin transport system substrate-specific component